MDEIQTTLLEQLKLINPTFKEDYNVSSIKEIDDGIRLVFRKRNQITYIDIYYNNKKDLYNIKSVRIKGNQSQIIWSSTDIHYKNLHKVIKSVLNI